MNTESERPEVVRRVRWSGVETEKFRLAVFDRHQAHLRSLPKGLFWAGLQSEPTNEADRGAVLVHVWQPVGYLPRYQASVLGPVVDLLASVGIMLEVPLRTGLGSKHDPGAVLTLPRPAVPRGWVRDLARGEFPEDLEIV